MSGQKTNIAWGARRCSIAVEEICEAREDFRILDERLRKTYGHFSHKKQ
ncbi:hypothetical protein [Tannerella forsythia]|uniref:Uncharacterized protein n=1 Tax=Tannerella forsythia (strain ATCC 43037 / JCM 10827 / CCUG 21028 A / KCTC 5666 / FDC 338) TaxID=203275 RepID=G8UNL3_TANFA|nr:hypothetical protein BFO_1784 [Tannerella forsythia 92A2]